MGLLQDLHTSTGTRVRVGSSISDRFSTSSGVRQGCVLAPALFNRTIDWIMEHTDSLKGIRVGDLAFKDLNYADDEGEFGVFLPTYLPTALAGFSTASKTMGLDVSWTKTKIQSLGTGLSLSSIVIAGQNV